MAEYTAYSPKELARTARWACKALGKYLRWELRTRIDGCTLVVYYRDKHGVEQSTGCAI